MYVLNERDNNICNGLQILIGFCFLLCAKYFALAMFVLFEFVAMMSHLLRLFTLHLTFSICILLPMQQ